MRKRSGWPQPAAGSSATRPPGCYKQHCESDGVGARWPLSEVAARTRRRPQRAARQMHMAWALLAPSVCTALRRALMIRADRVKTWHAVVPRCWHWSTSYTAQGSKCVRWWRQPVERSAECPVRAAAAAAVCSPAAFAEQRCFFPAALYNTREFELRRCQPRGWLRTRCAATLWPWNGPRRSEYRPRSLSCGNARWHASGAWQQP